MKHPIIKMKKSWMKFIIVWYQKNLTILLERVKIIQAISQSSLDKEQQNQAILMATAKPADTRSPILGDYVYRGY